MIALVEAIGSRAAADELSARLGVANWDARHSSAAFRLTFEHRWTFIRNKLTFWRHDAIGIKVDDDVDEIALGLMVDAYSRTELNKVITVDAAGGFVQAGVASASDRTHRPPPAPTPCFNRKEMRRLDRELARIASRYDTPTAAFVALTMEYSWSEQQARLVQD
jgi:hypothetical protein